MYEIDNYFQNFPTFFNGSIVRDFFDSISGSIEPIKKFPYPIDLYTNKDENGNAISTTLDVALAGLSKDEIKVKIENKSLCISIERDDQGALDKTYHIHNIAKRIASITYSLSPNADIENIKVSFTDGILRIKVPVKKEIIDANAPKFLEIE